MYLRCATCFVLQAIIQRFGGKEFEPVKMFDKELSFEDETIDSDILGIAIDNDGAGLSYEMILFDSGIQINKGKKYYRLPDYLIIVYNPVDGYHYIADKREKIKKAKL